jgi:23S rRNA pseudouridine1911/1915/1917 synthase
VPQDGVLDIPYENAGLIAVNKPCGMLVHPSRAKYTDTLANFVSGYLLKNDGSPACHAVNRLDRDTSGIVLFAKNAHYMSLSARALSSPCCVKELLGHSLRRAQYALRHGRPSDKAPSRGDMMRAVSPDGQRAVTHYETLRVFHSDIGPYSLLKLRLETGRTHQIRVHLSHLGHPLLGDGLYYTEESKALSDKLVKNPGAAFGPSLFIDPVSGKKADIRCPIKRDDLEKLLAEKFSS